MKERLQKIIANAGYSSRRNAEELIKSGKVTVNGAVAELGAKADTELDDIRIDGKPLREQDEKVYIMLHKPKGYVTTMSDEKGRRNVSGLVSDLGVRVYPVGRLDMYSEGLLLMTNDGDFANALMHPSHEVNKTYHVWVEGRIGEDSLRKMRSPMLIDGYKIKPAAVEVLTANDAYSMLCVTIHEGRNRQIRKMCLECNLKLTRLKRVSEGDVTLGDLQCGKWRKLSQEELHSLQK